ncbi:cellulose biosynthesis cyclic di-GMP-binding regulatory protein BcsB [Secundilactobacillus collinoides]|uniref:cellulose biosynthesis cyclic di-GMP-binding regulatory protein BcsB n=1 Tax=Secundilactobacillus collinoides TaxID=33960 RepID=UPI0022874939|nr:cellulose biosynthesis cyclic di-GMP-binding regulatory protein BcsB [Secundilactobacillus collinoides]
MNKFFINKQNGTKRSGINNWLIFLSVVLVGFGTFLTPRVIHAAATQTYTDQFQNSTTTLSGTSVTASMYFSKESYWNVKKATFNLSYQASQLTNKQTSDITVTVNGVKCTSFRPQTGDGTQTKEISIPTKLLAADNQLTVTGRLRRKRRTKLFRQRKHPQTG